MSDYAKHVMVSTDWVAEDLEDDRIRIVEVDASPELYDEAYHPGRDRLRLEARPPGSGSQAFPRCGGVRRADREPGLSNEHTVVLYGDRSNWFAAYTYWYFRYYGHNAVKLVNGPRAQWIAEERETSDTPPDHPAQEFFRAAHG